MPRGPNQPYGPTPAQIEHGKTEPKAGPWPERPKRPEHIKSVTSLRSAKGHRLCGSVIRTPGRFGDWLCHQPGMLTNGRCKMHGGRSPVGIYSKSFRGVTTGSRRSKVLEALGLGEMFEHFRTDPELAELKDEIAMIDIQVERALRRVEKNDNEKTRKELLTIINARRKLVDSVHKNTSAVVPVERVLAFMHAMVNLVFEFVTDPREKSKFLYKIRALSGRPADQLANGPMLDMLPKPESIGDTTLALQPETPVPTDAP